MRTGSALNGHYYPMRNQRMLRRLLELKLLAVIRVQQLARALAGAAVAPYPTRTWPGSSAWPTQPPCAGTGPERWPATVALGCTDVCHIQDKLGLSAAHRAADPTSEDMSSA